ncbi:MAG: hypothetical protein N3B10_11580, partial [Armatimonadetes bacterium]|nr:hypothetical protein [Armatimonadota bacterium]
LTDMASDGIGYFPKSEAEALPQVPLFAPCSKFFQFIAMFGAKFSALAECKGVGVQFHPPKGCTVKTIASQ